MCIPVDLEWKDAQHPVHIALDLCHAPFLPSPHLGRYVVHHLGVCGSILGLHPWHDIAPEPRRHTQIEAGIIHKHQPVGTEIAYGLAAFPHPLQYFPQVHEDRYETHIRQLRAIPIAYLRPVILPPYGVHQEPCVQVATRLSGNNKVSHRGQRYD